MLLEGRCSIHGVKLLNKVKNNEEIQDLVKILSNKWDRIMLLGDPDPDGAQIVMLVMLYS